ncbi:MAG: MopE-related protein [Vicinamibacterales bacterium]
MINYGGSGVGVSEDGKFLYVSCRQDAAGQSTRGLIAKVQIPGVGGSAALVQPCQGLPNNELVKVTGNPGDYFPTVGGILESGGKLIVNAFVTYDTSGVYALRHTFWSGQSLNSLAGPYEGAVRNGLVKGYMGHVPPEWQALLGGDSYATAGFTSIISRASYGAAFTVFNAADVKNDNFAMKFLLGCPYYEPGTYNFLSKCASRYGSPQSPVLYNGSEQSGGAFIVPGTRTLFVVEREADGPTCYGYATRDQSQHGLPYLDAVYCYSLSDPLMEKGPKGYPYRLVGKLFDLADLVDVKLGKKLPWDVDPYSVVTMPGSTAGEMIGYTGGGAFNPVTGQYYLSRELYPGTGGKADVAVFEGFPTSTGGSYEICGDGLDNDGDGLVDEGCATEVCGDGIDNDGDGLVDENCQGGVEICGDGIDNDGDGLVDEGCEGDKAVPGAPQRLYGSVKRSTVSLKWEPPITGGTVGEYVIQAGLAPGTTVYSAPVGLNTTLSVPDVGAGRYYVRVVARNANGSSLPSNEVTLSVGCKERPRKVSGLSAATRDGLVTLSWSDPDGCSGTSYRVALSNAVASQVLSTSEPALTTVLPSGTYAARVTARSDNGDSDSTTLQFTVNGNTCSTPRTHTSLRTVVAGRRVGLFWSPLDPDIADFEDRLSPLSYVIEAGTAPGASDIGVVPMARAKQLLIDAPRGTYYVRVRASNVCGAGPASNEGKLVVK